MNQEALFMGLLQGLTEFLPVSSSGHLAAAQLLVPGLAYPGVTLEVSTHVGTAMAVLVYYRSLLWPAEKARAVLEAGKSVLAISEKPENMRGEIRPLPGLLEAVTRRQ